MSYRRQHYVPAFWLALFTRDQHRNARFWAFDLPAARSKKNPFPTTPDNAGHQRDFNRIDVDGADPNEVEHLFQKFEDEAAWPMKTLATRAIGSTTVSSPTLFLTLDDRRCIFTLLGAQRMRGPDAAARVDEAFSAAAIDHMRRISASDEAFAAAQAKNPDPGDLTREDVLALLADPSFRWVLDRATHFKELLPELVEEGERLGNELSWQVWVSPPGGPFFIITDTPMTTISAENGPYAGTDIEVIPLSYRTALVGHARLAREPLTELGVAMVDGDVVALINGSLVARAQRFVWSVEELFLVAGDHGPATSDDVLDRAKRVVRARRRLAQREARRRVRRHR